MKQAILITAYKNFKHLELIIKFFNEITFEIFIHIDKKSTISNIQITSLKQYKSVKLISQKYKVNWGGINHLKSILLLSQCAFKSQEIKYFHLITGHDFPIKNQSYFKEYFESANLEYIEYFNIPKIGAADSDYMDRLEYFNFFDILNYKNPKDRLRLEFIRKVQKKIELKRDMNFRMPQLYGGSTYWSLSRACINHVMEFTKNNSYFLKRFKYTLCAEEFYFQTIIMNSSFASKVANENLRYIDWVSRNGNNPAVLDETDFEKLMQTNAVFARKFDYPHSIELINKINIGLSI
jgi:hypothetical protein